MGCHATIYYTNVVINGLLCNLSMKDGFLKHWGCYNLDYDFKTPVKIQKPLLSTPNDQQLNNKHSENYETEIKKPFIFKTFGSCVETFKEIADSVMI